MKSSNLSRLLWPALILAFSALVWSCRPPVDGTTPPIVAWVAVGGESMLPTFPEHSMVEMEFFYPYEKLQVGDTVIYWDYIRGQKAFTHHRIIEKQGPYFIVRGDNPVTNPVEDRTFLSRDNFVARGTGRWASSVYASK